MKMFSTRFVAVLSLALYAYNVCAAPLQIGDFAGIESPVDYDLRRDIKQPGEGVVVNNIALKDVDVLNNFNARDNIKQPGEGVVVNNIALKDVDVLNNFHPKRDHVLNSADLNLDDVINNFKRDTDVDDANVFDFLRYMGIDLEKRDGTDITGVVDKVLENTSLKTAKRCEPAHVNVGDVNVLSHDKLVGKRGGSAPIKIGDISIIKDNELVDRKRGELPNIIEVGDVKIIHNNEAIDRKRDILNDMGAMIGKAVGKVWRTVISGDDVKGDAETA